MVPAGTGWEAVVGDDVGWKSGWGRLATAAAISGECESRRGEGLLDGMLLSTTSFGDFWLSMDCRDGDRHDGA